MHGTTHCPYCTTRFRVTETQMEAHSGMVRCGYCRQTFDARPSFEPEQPSPQLELPIPEPELPVLDSPVTPPPPTLPVLQPMTLAEQVAIVDDEKHEPQIKERTLPWTVASLVLALALLAQAAYFFRVDLAARIPVLKPALLQYCMLLKCDVPLPQYAELIGIESSELEANPANASMITLKVLLRNRASYPQDFPALELTLTDSMDKALARRSFKPEDYLPPSENRTAGLRPNRELAIRLPLDTTDLKPMGYRLALFYPSR